MPDEQNSFVLVVATRSRTLGRSVRGAFEKQNDLAVDASSGPPTLTLFGRLELKIGSA